MKTVVKQENWYERANFPTKSPHLTQGYNLDNSVILGKQESDGINYRGNKLNSNIESWIITKESLGYGGERMVQLTNDEDSWLFIWKIRPLVYNIQNFNMD